MKVEFHEQAALDKTDTSLDSVTEETRSGPTGSRTDELIALFALGAVVALFVLLLINLQTRIEAGAVTLTDLLPVGYAFGAGMVASVNPCGFFLLPSYFSYQLGTDEAGFYDASPQRRLFRALMLGGTATLGFVALFATIGTVLGLGGTRLVSTFPYAGVAIGVAMTGLGLFLLASRRSLSLKAPERVLVDRKRNQRNVFLFGIGYAVASLCCTLPIFLVVVGTSIATGNWLTSLSQFVSYALGMGVILVSVTIGSALFRGAVAKSMRKVMPFVSHSSSLFLVAAGAYILYYWLFYADYFF